MDLFFLILNIIKHTIIKKIPAKDALIAIPTDEPCAVDRIDVGKVTDEFKTELDAVEIETDNEVTLIVEMSDDMRAEDFVVVELNSDADADKVIEVAVPIFDPIENKLIGLFSGQQLALCRGGFSSMISQHIKPPSAAD